VKNDPGLIAAARELRDRYLEQFYAGKVLPTGKYEVCRQIEAKQTSPAPPRPCSNKPRESRGID
jgi:hypothetical protein